MFKKTAVTLSIATLIGCTGTYHSNKSGEENNKADKALTIAEGRLNKPAYTVTKTPTMAISKTPISVEQSMMNVLKDKKVFVHKTSESIPLSAILESLNAQGVNITSQINLDKYRYSGFPINETDAITALEILTGTLGLDFTLEKISSGAPLVYISSLNSETKILNVGPRNVTSQMGTNSASSSSNQQASSSSTSQLNVSSTTISSGATASITSSVEDDFWEKLQKELEERMRRPIPRAERKFDNQAALTTSTPEDESRLFDLVQLGHVVVNSSTGAVTVMAPRTIRREIMDYLDKISYQLNSSIILRGQVIVTSNDEGKSEGIDWGGLLSTGEGVLAYSNDVLGNAVISLPGQFADVSASNAIASSLLGYQRADRVLRLFNGYLSRDSRNKTLQMPVATTTSGTPVNLTDVESDYQIIVNTDRSTTEGGTTNTGITNNILTFQYGTNLTLTPRVDIEKDIIRTDVNLQLKIRQRDKDLNQLVSNGNSVELNTITLPIIKELNYQGQALLKPGEVVIMGGQTVDIYEDSNGGITGLKDGILGGLFGNRSETKRTVTYYFLLSAEVVPYGA